MFVPKLGIVFRETSSTGGVGWGWGALQKRAAIEVVICHELQ